MADDPEVGYRIVATVVGAEGHCHAGHNDGDTFEFSCHNPAGLCGFFYHNLFPNLFAFQFGANPPWWQNDTIQHECPDRRNLVTLKLERFERT